MKPNDMMKLAVRFLGLVFLYHALRGLPVVASAIASSLEGWNLGTVLFAIPLAFWQLAVAYWLLRGAPFRMKLAYSEEPKNSEPETNVFGYRSVEA